MDLHLKAGVAQVNITPPVGIPLSGYIARKEVSQGIHDELYTKAIVLENKREEIVIIGNDLIGLLHQTVDEIRELIRERTGVKKDNIMISCTHTHSGPDTLYGLYSRGKSDRAWMKTLSLQIAGCVFIAWKNKKEAKIGVGKGEIEGIGVNRRNPDGKPIDPEVGVVKIEDIEGKLLAIIINYTCHPTVLGADNLLISADYPGYTTRTLQKIKGDDVVVMFTNGAEGDINTGHSADISGIGGKIPGRNFERAQRLGTMLAGEVLRVSEKIETSTRAYLGMTKEVIELPLREFSSLEEAGRDLKQKREYVERLTKERVSSEELSKARIEEFHAEIRFILAKRAQQVRGESLKVEIQGMVINDTAFIAIPGEPFVEIGLKIKKLSPFKNTFLLGLTNGEIGYIPTRMACGEESYESVSTMFTCETESKIVETALGILHRMSEEK